MENPEKGSSSRRPKPFYISVLYVRPPADCEENLSRVDYTHTLTHTHKLTHIYTHAATAITNLTV